MPHDPARVEETAAWLNKSFRDLLRARRNLALDPPDTEDGLFHCQQAVEKSLKAFLVWRDRPFRKTHDLEELAHVCSGLDPALANATRGLAPLTRFAWEYRYPGENPPPAVEEARGWIERVERLLDAIEAVLPDDVPSFRRPRGPASGD